MPRWRSHPLGAEAVSTRSRRSRSRLRRPPSATASPPCRDRPGCSSSCAAISTVLAFQTASTAGIGDTFALSSAVLRGIPTAVAFLIPAALFLRHRAAWQTDRLLVVGTVLFGVVELLQFASAGRDRVVRLGHPAGPDVGPAVPLNVTYNVVVGLIGALAPAATGRGLLAARAYEDGRRRAVVVAGRGVPDARRRASRTSSCS